MIEYRGIKISESVKRFTNQMKKGIDTLITKLTEKNHILLSEYRNSATKVLIDFQCGHEPHWIRPNDYRKGYGCPKCGHQVYSKSFEEKKSKARTRFEKALKEKGYELLEEYINSGTKVLVDFKCGHEPHSIRPNDFEFKKVGCPICGHNRGGKKKTLKWKIKFEKAIKDNGHILLSEYQGVDVKVLIDYKCGHEPYWKNPSDYFYKDQTKSCPRCSFKTPEEIEAELIRVVTENNHILLSDYVKRSEKVLIDYKCGHEPHWIAPDNYFQGNNCPSCAGRNLELVKENFINLVKDNGHLLLTEYERTESKVLIDFKCGHDAHWIRPNDYKRGKGCPKCGVAISRGVETIYNWLDANMIEYQLEYILPKRKWRYDIYIPFYNVIVEVHGLQHYKEIPFFSSRTLEEEQENDRNKKDHAESLGYNYMIVDYREHDPNLALKRFLDQFRAYKPNRRNKSRQGRKYEQLTLF